MVQTHKMRSNDKVVFLLEKILICIIENYKLNMSHPFLSVTKMQMQYCVGIKNLGWHIN